MNLQKIKSIDGKDEYVLLPVKTYKLLKIQINKALDDEYIPFVLEEHVKNPVALARIKARWSQEKLAKYLNTSQAYISKVESQAKVSNKLMVQINQILAIKKK
jgi:ribosome-binding protein aMBF1 (putative translation factor)